MSSRLPRSGEVAILKSGSIRQEPSINPSCKMQDADATLGRVRCHRIIKMAIVTGINSQVHQKKHVFNGRKGTQRQIMTSNTLCYHFFSPKPDFTVPPGIISTASSLLKLKALILDDCCPDNWLVGCLLWNSDGPSVEGVKLVLFVLCNGLHH